MRPSTSFGYRTLLLDRQTYVEILYNHLPDKSRVATGKLVRHIEQTDIGVRVVLEDGRTEKGAIVIGADGVHSMARDFMWKHANTLAPGSISVEEKTCTSDALAPSPTGCFSIRT